jgi:hypothetical protein
MVACYILIARTKTVAYTRADLPILNRKERIAAKLYAKK